MSENYFTELNSINVQDKIEKKGNLSYLSWAYAWAEVKKRHPDAVYTVYENADGWNYHTDGRTCWVKTGVTVNGIEHIEYLPVMDYKNSSIPLDKVTSFDVNKAIQRSLTKAVARHGLGLYIYAGEDLPESEKKEAASQPAKSEAPRWQLAIMSAVESNFKDKKDAAEPLKEILSRYGYKKVQEVSENKASAVIEDIYNYRRNHGDN